VFAMFPSGTDGNHMIAWPERAVTEDSFASLTAHTETMTRIWRISRFNEGEGSFFVVDGVIILKIMWLAGYNESFPNFDRSQKGLVA